ncbi:MAG: FAD-dependent thymidylate synthase [Cyanobacteria bacterium J06607_13]
MDARFTVEVISQTPNPQQTIYAAMHQDYAEDFVAHERETWPSEAQAGDVVIKNLLKGGRGHFGPLEHPQIVLNVGWFPHSTMQQIRTHRVGVSFDVQSFRYTGKRIYEFGKKLSGMGLTPFSGVEEKLFCYDDDGALKNEAESIFYLRPSGEYSDRQGKKYEYGKNRRDSHLEKVSEAAVDYFDDIESGLSEEHARGLIPFDVRQHWVMSANVRSLMHLLDLRWKADAQLEAQQLCELAWPHFEAWVPAIAEWYAETRKCKARLAP